MLTLPSGTVLEQLIQKSYETGDLVVHFFCTHSDHTRLTASQLFRSYIKQIISHLSIIKKPCPENVKTPVKRLFGQKAIPPKCVEVIELFHLLAKMLAGAIYLVDGLDE